MLRSIGLGVASGLLLAVAMPGPGLWGFAFVALIPWAWATRQAGRRLEAFLTDYACGVAFFVPTLIWLARITAVAFLPVVLLAPLFVCMSGWLFRSLATRMPSALALPLAWLAPEMARSLLHFPWDLFGYAAAGWLDLAGLTALGGPFFLSCVLASVNGALLDLRPIPLVAAAVLLAGGALLGGTLRRSGALPVTPGPLIACLQPNVAQELKDSMDGKAVDKLWRDLIRLSKEGAEKGAELIVIPETMFPFWIAVGLPRDRVVDSLDPKHPIRAGEMLDDETDGLRILRRAVGPKPWLLAGVFLWDAPGGAGAPIRFRNSAVLYDASDRRVGRYSKVHLVPGSERLPLLQGAFGDWIRHALDPFTGQMMVDMEPGAGAVVLDAGSLGKIAPSICYDNVFPDLYREGAKQGADYFVVLSNEAWFPSSFEMDAMLGFSAFRAIETRRAIVRCTNSGISCMVAPDGSLASVFAEGGRRSEIGGVFLVRPPIPEAGRSPSTPYLALGDAPLYALAAFGVLLALVRRLPRRLDPLQSADKLRGPNPAPSRNSP